MNPDGSVTVSVQEKVFDSFDPSIAAEGELPDLEEPVSARMEWVPLGIFSAPWVVDANGVEVPTWFEISGNQITQVVDLSSEEIAYPVVADPDYTNSCNLVRCQRHFAVDVSLQVGRDMANSSLAGWVFA